MTLTNRDAMAYVLWRWLDMNVRPVHVRQAEAIVDDMLAVCPVTIRRRAAARHTSRRAGGGR